MAERTQTTSGEPARGLLLSDKHIVFAVMAATAVAVIVFLCGVFVGRGALAAHPPGDGRGQDGGLISADGPGPTSDGDNDAGGPEGDTGPGAPPLPPAGISYPSLARSKSDPGEKLEPPAPTLKLPDPPPEAPEDPPPSALPVRPADSAASRPAAVKEDPGNGPYTIQVASFGRPQKADAQRIVDSLKRNGFPAYLSAPATGSTDRFRVRVGTFKSRQEADVMAARLQKAKYTTWITRLPS